MPGENRGQSISSRLQRRIRRARKTTSAREFELMQTLRPGRPSVLAEGDSWFAYPPPNLAAIDDRSNIVNWLCRERPLNLLQLASNGDEAVGMLTGNSKHRLLRTLQRFEFDFILFSGGGNDIVGRHDFEFLLRDTPAEPAKSATDFLHLARAHRRLDMVELAYAELMDFCRAFSRNPDVRIVTHCYDYAVPSPRGARFLGGLLRPDHGRSWMYPALRRKRVPEAMYQPIARWLIDGLASRLQRLETEGAGLLQVVDTRGLLTTRQWVNEIHPDREGFARIGSAVLARLQSLDARFGPPGAG